MGLDDRLMYLLLGVCVGFILGYITRTLREIKEELYEVDGRVSRKRDDAGFMRYPVVADVMVVLVVVITVWAAFASQRASNEVRDNQDQIARITECNQVFLSRTIQRLNERTEYSGEQARANVQLQTEQAKLLAALLVQPPPTAVEGRAALEEYYESGVRDFIEANDKALKIYKENPYPTEEELSDCFSGRD